MSYRTYYTFDILSTDEDLKNKIIDDLRETYPDAFDSFNEEGYPELDNSWYRHDEDMLEFSKKYPDVVMILSGEGEESCDTWNTYYKNGKIQHCPAIITYDEYDETKLS